MILLIVATDSNYGIAKNGAIPWKNKIDMTHFKRQTCGNVVLMGRKTWDSLPIKPLPNRKNIVISSTMKPTDNITVLPSIERAMQLYTKDEKWYIIGGASLYNYFFKHISLLDRILWTRMNDEYICDTVIDPIPILGFKSIESEYTTSMNRKLRGIATYYEYEK